MNQLFENIPLVKNEAKKRFEIEVNGQYAFTRYSNFGDQFALVHTEMTPEMAEQGGGSALIGKILRYLEGEQLKLLPFCPFVFAYIQRYPAWKSMVVKNSGIGINLEGTMEPHGHLQGFDRMA